MQDLDGTIVYSAGDLVGYLECEHLTTLERAVFVTDLERLLAEDGLAGVPVLPVSAKTGEGVAEVLEAIGAEVAPIFCEVDGKFPNHHPDPSDPKNLTDVINMVARLDADLGLAFDGDGDRLGVVTRKGEIIYADRVLMLLAARRAQVA